jgi:sulfite reductase (NADPH) hemoprotein beta-component
MNYLEAVVRVYNRWGRRDNLYKARIKILVKAEGQRFIDEVECEFNHVLHKDGGPHTISQAEFDRVAACFVEPKASHTASSLRKDNSQEPAFQRWLKQNVVAHKNPALRAVTLSFKRLGLAPGDATAAQLEASAQLVTQYSRGEARVTHAQNLVLPWVEESHLYDLWQEAKALGLATPNVGLLNDMIACPGGDYCALANARAIPVAAAISERYQDLDELDDLGSIDLHISGCINSCGHHHSGHIGILGVDKDGKEWYQVTLGGSDGASISGAAAAGKVVGPSFSAAEVPEVIEAVINKYLELRLPTDHGANGRHEYFIETLRREGHDSFKVAANSARHPEASLAEGAD